MAYIIQFKSLTTGEWINARNRVYMFHSEAMADYRMLQERNPHMEYRIL